jgi:peroxiredoxin
MAEDMHATLLPGRKVPDFAVPLASGEEWRLSLRAPRRYTLIDFYRGRHCPRCHLHILDLKQKLPRLQDRGVEAIAISMDSKAKALDAVAAWGLEGLDVGYDLEESQARALGLYLSDMITDREPARFSEPATLLVRPDGVLYSAHYATSPFARIHGADILEALDAIAARDYPPRGNVA